jgi:hypothetical protein
MRDIKHIAKTMLLAACIAVLFPVNSARGTIASITLNPANPTSLSNGLSYYLAGKTYFFIVQVIDPDLTAWSQVGLVQLTIPNTPNIVLRITPSGTGAGLPVTITSGGVNATADVSGTYNNYTVTFNVTIRWDTPESAYASSRNIIAQATTTDTKTDNALAAYGVCSTMKILNLAADGVAADGMVNRWHDAFTISGTPVYNVTGATTSDAIETIDVGEISVNTNLTLYLNGVTTGITSSVALPACSFSVTAALINASGTTGNNTFRVVASVATPGGPVSSVNTVVLNCDEVEVTGISFVNGGGINSPYYRSTNIPGTEIVVTARMRYSGVAAMKGNTTIRIYNYTDAVPVYIDVVILDGASTGTASVSYPTGAGLPTVPPGTGTIQNYYRVESIIGGSYGGDVAGGQNASGRINQPAIGSVYIYWDNGAYPWWTSTPFTAWGSASSTAYSLTFNWTGFGSLTAPNQDFSSYRIYYKEQLAAVYQLIDKTTTGYASLGTCSTNTATITGLIPLTNYEYYITAIDVFGQEVPIAQALPAGAVASIATLASTITVTMSDGITTYENNSFTIPPGPDVPANRPLRKTSIKVKVFIVAAGDLPDIVNLIVADNGLATNLVTGSAITGTLVLNTDYYRISTLKTGANEWTGFIPDTNPLITVGNEVKFIIETIKSGVASYADNNSETETPPGDPNDYEFSFAITSQPTFKPWPTRILNNVITEKNPRAYPAYYLTDDAYVSIVVYDIKGRVVKTLLDKAYRSGGQNIKEDGWQGDNKSNKKVGVGLYYIHFRAERASDGRVILDSFQKVVMAR